MSSEDPWLSAVRRFATWFAEHSPYHRELRTEVALHNGAPRRLRQFWAEVGWTPGVGYAGRHEPLRPERHVTRRAADRAFRQWAADPRFAPALGLPAAGPAAVWDRLPEYAWIVHVRPKSYGGRPGGGVSYVDEAAGDDPPLWRWAIDEAPGDPVVETPSAVAGLMRMAVVWHFWNRSADVTLPAPAEPGPFAPAWPGCWELAPGVWGLADRDDPATIDRVVYRSAADYAAHLADLPAHALGGHRLTMKNVYLFTLEDAKLLHPDRLVGQGFATVPDHNGAPVAVGRFAGMPITVHAHGDGKPSAFVYVMPEDQPRFRELMKREKLRSYDTHQPVRDPILHPNAKDRQLVERLYREAAGAAPAPPEPAPRAAPTADEAAVCRDAAALRQRLLRAYPHLALKPVRADGSAPVAALWRELGWDDALRPVAGWPDLESSEHALADALDDYRGWDSPLGRDRLPRVCRLLHVDQQGVGLLLTDESGTADDPPVLAAVADTGAVVPEHPSYLHWVGTALARHAFAPCHGYDLPGDPGLDEAGELVYPRLAPGVRRLAEGVWAVPPAWYAPTWRLAATDVATLDAWLGGPDPLARRLRRAPR
jgi:hypothetical protein